MRTAEVCPTCSTYTNAKCSIYTGPYLSTLNINTLDNVEIALEKLDIWATTVNSKEDGSESKLTKEIVASINVGGITIGQTFPIGTPFTTFAEALVSPTLLPSILTTQSLIVSNVATATLEVGSTYTRQINVLFSPGSIQSKNGSPNVPLVGAATSTNYSGPGVNPAGLISTQISLGTNQWSVVLDYTAGTAPYYDSTGNVSNILDGSRGAGSLTALTAIVTGRYRYWHYTGTVASSPASSGGIRALGATGFAGNTNFNISIPAGRKEVSFYIPAGNSLVSVLYAESSNANVTLTFALTNINVEDAGGNIVPYKKYTAVIGGTGYPNVATYKVTII
jgi:hypothetical protein